jgi:hypothetical protein
MTFYWLKPTGKGFTRVAVGGLDRWPNDWVEVKMTLAEVMHKLYVEYETSFAILLLERHLPGKKFMAFQGYKRNPFTYKRDKEGYFEVEYVHWTGEVTVKLAVFGSSLSFLIPQYMAMERARPFHVPSLIPKDYTALLRGSASDAGDWRTVHKRYGLEPSGRSHIGYGRQPLTPYPSLETSMRRLPYERLPPVFPAKQRFKETAPPRQP